VQKALDDNVPVVVMVKRGTDRHYLLATGYRPTNQGFQYKIFDPADGSSRWAPKTGIASSIVGVVYTKR
jgi:hypothetical protein